MTGDPGSPPDGDDSAFPHRIGQRRRAASRPAGPPATLPLGGNDSHSPATSPDAGPDPDTRSMTGTGPTAAEDDAGTALGDADPVSKADRRREKRRRSRTDRANEPARAEVTAAPAQPDGAAAPRRLRRTGSDRAAQALEGNRATQVPSSEAMRARDWAAPTAEDLATAEAELVIVRRHYKPPEPLPSKGSAAPRAGGPASSAEPDGRRERRQATGRS